MLIPLGGEVGWEYPDGLRHDRNLWGHSKIGWLDSWHTFSFSSFQDLNRMGFRSLELTTESNAEILLFDLS